MQIATKCYIINMEIVRFVPNERQAQKFDTIFVLSYIFYNLFFAFIWIGKVTKKKKWEKDFSLYLALGLFSQGGKMFI